MGLNGDEEKDAKNSVLYRLKRYQDIILKIPGMISADEEKEERNDVCIYKTLRYPPKSTPPTINCI
jgi:hypothetical protein